MGYKIVFILSLVLGVFLLFKGVLATQKRDKRYKKGVKYNSNIKLLFYVILSLFCFYLTFKLSDFL
jgi:uncharacterized membrane protein HdeD (DUF308 family)